MQSSIPLLSLAIWVPIVFGFIILALGEDRHAGIVRGLSLVGAIAGFVISLMLLINFVPDIATMQATENVSWFSSYKINYHLGIDGMSLWFVILTAFITVIVVIAGWEVIQERVAQYMAAFLILSGLMIGEIGRAHV